MRADYPEVVSPGVLLFSRVRLLGGIKLRPLPLWPLPKWFDDCAVAAWVWEVIHLCF
jgi:hypothetical protein